MRRRRDVSSCRQRCDRRHQERQIPSPVVRANSTKIPSPRKNLAVNAPRIRAGATKTDQKAELKRPNPQALPPPQTSISPLISLSTRQARDAKSAKWKRSDRRPAAQQDPPRRSGRRSRRARGDNSRPKHRKSPPSGASSHHQRPRCANNKTTTTAIHPELRDLLPNLSDDRSRRVACSRARCLSGTEKCLCTLVVWKYSLR